MNRGTGRSTKTLLKVFEDFIDGKNVILLVPHSAHADYTLKIVLDMAHAMRLDIIRREHSKVLRSKRGDNILSIIPIDQLRPERYRGLANLSLYEDHYLWDCWITGRDWEEYHRLRAYTTIKKTPD